MSDLSCKLRHFTSAFAVVVVVAAVAVVVVAVVGKAILFCSNIQ